MKVCATSGLETIEYSSDVIDMDVVSASAIVPVTRRSKQWAWHGFDRITAEVKFNPIKETVNKTQNFVL